MRCEATADPCNHGKVAQGRPSGCPATKVSGGRTGDVIVNMVGGAAGTALYPAESYPEDVWDRIVDLNQRFLGLRGGQGRARRAHAPAGHRMGQACDHRERHPPTFVATEQAANLLADESFRTGLEARIPLRRIADTDDVVGASLLLCTDAASFITGQVLTLDGGLTACQ
jgi:gluconate 5-dehydrogenase